VPIGNCIVIGDSTWDVLAAGRKSTLGVGLLSGGPSREELERAAAYRVYADPADLFVHLEDRGIPESRSRLAELQGPPDRPERHIILFSVSGSSVLVSRIQSEATTPFRRL
jgi:hypothetical protein